MAAYNERERHRIDGLALAQLAHDTEVAQIKALVEAQNREVDEFRSEFEAGDPEVAEGGECQGGRSPATGLQHGASLKFVDLRPQPTSTRMRSRRGRPKAYRLGSVG